MYFGPLKNNFKPCTNPPAINAFVLAISVSFRCLLFKLVNLCVCCLDAEGPPDCFSSLYLNFLKFDFSCYIC